MSFQVQTETLIDHSTLWGGHAGDATTARTTIHPAVGKGEDFGYLAGLNQVADHYDTWSTAMEQALRDAERCFHYLEAALRSVAHTYDDSDATAGTDMGALDAMI
jgi:hypothetical protein